MFSGIIKGVGRVASYDTAAHRLSIQCPLFADGVILGASIAIDGVCLTVAHIGDSSVLGFDLGEETRKVTLLGQEKLGHLVNVEYALRLGDTIDGHMVQGHVDGLARLVEKTEVSGNLILRFAITLELGRYMVPKGSIAVNGVSLTINEIDDHSFSVCLVPYTIEHTSFKEIDVNDRVHIETDIMARYAYKFATTSQHVTSYAK